ncbi:DUF2267 domain-containing protein [Halosolutus halophilus]|uniref:DUF2267 domain-containing protein n=1 Tax=Halosolutus halophilus TaxID=1552990 RepID=UPI0022351C65|nr:DUF2267 domain-containing protein [Halosolutus halophilus]
MKYDGFIGEVQHRAQLDSREAALGTSRVTLTTLSERIDPGLAENLGAKLPEKLGRFREEVDDVERFAFDEFVDRVVEREDIGEVEPADAAFHAQVVVDVVDEAVTEGALQDVEDQPPDGEGYENLFEIADAEGSPT